MAAFPVVVSVLLDPRELSILIPGKRPKCTAVPTIKSKKGEGKSERKFAILRT